MEKAASNWRKLAAESQKPLIDIDIN